MEQEYFTFMKGIVAVDYVLVFMDKADASLEGRKEAIQLLSYVKRRLVQMYSTDRNASVKGIVASLDNCVEDCLQFASANQYSMPGNSSVSRALRLELDKAAEKDPAIMYIMTYPEIRVLLAGLALDDWPDKWKVVRK